MILKVKHVYLIYAQDVPSSLENRLAVRPAHWRACRHCATPAARSRPNPAIDSNDPGAAGFYRFDGDRRIRVASGSGLGAQDPYIAAGVYADL